MTNTTNTIRAYMRASSQEQDASRAKEQMEAFALSHGRSNLSWYVENESGSTLKRPELMRLLQESNKGDVLLLEQVDRLSRLNASDWEILKAMMQAKGVIVVSIDLPTSYALMVDPSTVDADSTEGFNQRALKAINGMMLDMLGAIARKDYEDRRRRQAQGIKTAKAEGKFKGRQPDLDRHERIRKLLAAGLSYSDIQATLEGVSRATIAKIAKTLPVSSDSECAIG